MAIEKGFCLNIITVLANVIGIITIFEEIATMQLKAGRPIINASKLHSYVELGFILFFSLSPPVKKKNAT